MIANFILSWKLIALLFLFLPPSLSLSPPPSVSLFLRLFLLEIIPLTLCLHKSLNPGRRNKAAITREQNQQGSGKREASFMLCGFAPVGGRDDTSRTKGSSFQLL